MITGSPDSWIERRPASEYGTTTDDAGYCEVCEEHIDSGKCPGHCENETCDHVGHCDVCGAGFTYELVEETCLNCEVRWRAKHQIGQP